MSVKGEWKFVQPQIGGVEKYQYNGKELNEDFGFNWNAVDPLAEKFKTWSPYNYAVNNPIKANLLKLFNRIGFCSHSKARVLIQKSKNVEN